MGNREIPDLDMLFELADLFKVFGELVRARREGKQIYYTLDDDHVKKIIEMGIDHLME